LNGTHEKLDNLELAKTFKKKEYYSSKMSLRGKIMYLWHKRLKNIMVQKLEFDVPIYCFDIGFNISHISPVTINSNARIGKIV
jgi:serine acetyltransferase